MTQVNPTFTQTMTPAMILVAIMSGTLLGLPNPLLGSRESGIFRSFKINGIPSFSIISIPALTSVLHMALISAVITVAGPIFFDAAQPTNWIWFIVVWLASAFACAGLGMLIGVIAPNSRATVLLGTIDLPSIHDPWRFDDAHIRIACFPGKSCSSTADNSCHGRFQRTCHGSIGRARSNLQPGCPHRGWFDLIWPGRLPLPLGQHHQTEPQSLAGCHRTASVYRFLRHSLTHYQNNRKDTISLRFEVIMKNEDECTNHSNRNYPSKDRSARRWQDGLKVCL